MARVELFAFPYAGGTAGAVRSWRALLGAHIAVRAVQLPARDALVLERPLADYAEALAYFRRTLLPALEPPFAFYGHSMGAHLAFEVARELRRCGGPGPVSLFVSGAPAPQFGPPGPFAHLPDDEFVHRLRVLGGTPSEVLENEELLSFYLPLLRADFALAESYRYVDDEPLDCPISVWGGTEDGHPRRHLEAWREQTSAEFVLRMLPGGHFFIRDAERELVRALAHDLERALRPLVRAN